jgi:hypothetical protein
VGSSELGPIYRRTGHPSSCRPRHTDRVVERRSEEPPLTARIQAASRPRCRLCKCIAEPKIRIHLSPAGSPANFRSLGDGEMKAWLTGQGCRAVMPDQPYSRRSAGATRPLARNESRVARCPPPVLLAVCQQLSTVAQLPADAQLKAEKRGEHRYEVTGGVRTWSG